MTAPGKHTSIPSAVLYHLCLSPVSFISGSCPPTSLLCHTARLGESALRPYQCTQQGQNPRVSLCVRSASSFSGLAARVCPDFEIAGGSPWLNPSATHACFLPTLLFFPVIIYVTMLFWGWAGRILNDGVYCLPIPDRAGSEGRQLVRQEPASSLSLTGKRLAAVGPVSKAWPPACGTPGRWGNLWEVELGGRK